MNKRVLSFIKFLLIILFALSYYYLGGNRGFNLDFGYFFPHFVSLIFIALAMVKLKKNNPEGDLNTGFKYTFIPEFIVILLGFVMFLIFGYSFSYFKHWISSSLLYLLPILESYALIFIFKDEALDIIFKASVISYSIIIIYFIINNGIVDLFLTLYNQLFNNSGTYTILEAHEITFVFGLFLLYYINNPKKYKFRIALCVLFLLLGFKRILALAIIIALVFGFVAKKIKDLSIYKVLIIITSIIIVISCYLWIFLLKDGYLENNYYIAETYKDSSGISGRLLLSFQLSNIYDFEVTYLGKGFSYVDQYRIEHIYNNKLALHNDLLRKYIEYGFIMYGVYLFFRLYFISKKLLSYRNKDNSISYMMIMISTVICWLTDNTAGYFVYLVCFNSIVLYLFYNKDNEVKR